MKIIAMDTSSILFAIKNKVNPFDAAVDQFPGYAITISRGVLEELKKLSAKRGKVGSLAKVAISMVKSSSIEIASNASNVDKWLIGIAAEGSAIICTNDSSLKRAVKGRHAKAVSISANGKFR